MYLFIDVVVLVFYKSLIIFLFLIIFDVFFNYFNILIKNKKLF